MACDHLEVDTFLGSMNKINGKYGAMYVAYSNSLTQAFQEMKNAWDTPKGWEKVQTLASSLYRNMSSLGRSIESNYTEMKDSGTKWANAQHVWFFNCPPITQHTFTEFNPGKHDGKLNEVKREEVKNAATSIKNALQTIFDALNDMENVTREDASFGYYSTGGTNPRAALNVSLSTKESAMENAFQSYMKNITDEIDADNQEREAALQTEMDDTTNWDLNNG